MNEQVAQVIGVFVVAAVAVSSGAFLLYRAGPGWEKFRETKEAKWLFRGSGGEFGPRISLIGVGIAFVAMGILAFFIV